MYDGNKSRVRDKAIDMCDKARGGRKPFGMLFGVLWVADAGMTYAMLIVDSYIRGIGESTNEVWMGKEQIGIEEEEDV